MTDPGRDQQGGHKDTGGPQPEPGMQGMAAAYQGAVEAVLAVVVATLAGYWVDGHFGTSPAFLLFGLVLGFAAFCVRLWRLRDLMGGPPGQGPKPPEST